MTDSSKKFSYQDIATAAKTGFDWISKVCDPKVLEVAKQKNLKVELCKLVNEATAASEVLPTNISLGVFGASQAGKSYLVCKRSVGRRSFLAERLLFSQDWLLL